MSLAGIQTPVSIASKGRFVGFITNRFYQGHIKWCGEYKLVKLIIMPEELDPYINIIIALLGLAYPILLQVISRLDEKYESEYIAKLFKSELEWSAFTWTLIASLLSVFFYTLNLEPIIQVSFLQYYIDNSAVLFVIISTILLVVSFFMFVSKVLIYYTPHNLVPYLIKRFEKIKNDEKLIPEMADLLILSIKRQETNLSRKISNFFYTAFRSIREKYTDKPVVYPYEYYNTVYRAIEELAILKEKRNYQLEHRTSGGVWLLGEMQHKQISEITYTWLWRNLLLAVQYQQDDLVVYHWETCNQYYTLYLTSIYPEYDSSNLSFEVSNQEQVDKREVERMRFIEFHYALGGLLTYRKQFECLKRIFSFTQSQPPRYELLPESMQEIFVFYNNIRNQNNSRFDWISTLYPFPETSGIKSDDVIKRSIMSYMALLFLRQYTIQPFLITMRPMDFPRVPDTQGEIKLWIDGIDFFKKLVSEHLKNEDLKKVLDFDFITESYCIEKNIPYPLTFLGNFKDQLQEVYHLNALDMELSTEKIEQFVESTRTILEQTFRDIMRLSRESEINEESIDKWFVNGQRSIQSKDAFSLNPEVHHMNFDSFLAEVVAQRNYEGLAEIFLRKTTNTFLLKPQDFFKGIEQLKLNNKFVLVNFGMNLQHYIDNFRIDRLSVESYGDISIYSFKSNHLVRESMFVIKKEDLPLISSREINQYEQDKYHLKKTSKEINLYTSVVDFNKTSPEFIQEHLNNKTEDELRKSVLLNIGVIAEYKWKSNIKVLQIRQYSEFLHKGIANNLNEVTSFY